MSRSWSRIRAATCRSKALTRAAGAFLEDLPEPQVATAAYENGQPLPWCDVERDGSYVRFEVLPMRPNAASLTAPDARIVGMGPAIGGPVDSSPGAGLIGLDLELAAVLGMAGPAALQP
jgi:hypothetical protein